MTKKLPVFAITENWMVSEVRYYEAKNEEEAKRLSGTSGWLGLGHGPQFEEFHGIESIKRLEPKEITEMLDDFRYVEALDAHRKTKMRF